MFACDGNVKPLEASRVGRKAVAVFSDELGRLNWRCGRQIEEFAGGTELNALEIVRFLHNEKSMFPSWSLADLLELPVAVLFSEMAALLRLANWKSFGWKNDRFTGGGIWVTGANAMRTHWSIRRVDTIAPCVTVNGKRLVERRCRCFATHPGRRLQGHSGRTEASAVQDEIGNHIVAGVEAARAFSAWRLWIL